MDSEQYSGAMGNPDLISYFFTTFPKQSEQFLQREVRLLLEEFPGLELISIHQGEARFAGVPVQRFSKWRLGELLWWIPYWMLVRPRAFFGTLSELFRYPCPDFLNFQETLLGLAYALINGRRIQRTRDGYFHHATWATMPASATLLLRRLIARPFSMEAHAYDIFKKKGDWLIQPKIRESAFIRTSTEAGRARLIQLGATEEKIILVRRGLANIPEESPPNPQSPQAPIEILSSGRFVPKKGLFDLLNIAHYLQEQGVDFRLTLAGDGPLRQSLESRNQALGLDSKVDFAGFLPPAELESCYQRSHYLFFCGKVAEDGDRDGLPNVIPEAMARGVVVFSTPVGATGEAIHDEENGYLLPGEDPQVWHHRVLELINHPGEYLRLRRNARQWVEANYNLKENLPALTRRLQVQAGALKS